MAFFFFFTLLPQSRTKTNLKNRKIFKPSGDELVITSQIENFNLACVWLALKKEKEHHLKHMFKDHGYLLIVQMKDDQIACQRAPRQNRRKRNETRASSKEPAVERSQTEFKNQGRRRKKERKALRKRQKSKN